MVSSIDNLKYFDAEDELCKVGFESALDPVNVFEASGHVFVHHFCAAWSRDVTESSDGSLMGVDSCVSKGLSQVRISVLINWAISTALPFRNAHIASATAPVCSATGLVAR